MILYHASPDFDIHNSGIRNDRKTTCGRFNDGYIYLGSLEYLENQYFRYCPKGRYYIFEVDVPEEKAEYLERVDHYRVLGNIESDYVKPHGVRTVK